MVIEKKQHLIHQTSTDLLMQLMNIFMKRLQRVSCGLIRPFVKEILMLTFLLNLKLLTTVTFRLNRQRQLSTVLRGNLNEPSKSLNSSFMFYLQDSREIVYSHAVSKWESNGRVQPQKRIIRQVAIGYLQLPNQPENAQSPQLRLVDSYVFRQVGNHLSYSFL